MTLVSQFERGTVDTVVRPRSGGQPGVPEIGECWLGAGFLNQISKERSRGNTRGSPDLAAGCHEQIFAKPLYSL